MTTPEEARKEANLIAGRYAMHATAKRLRDLADQIEALQADAERYRWLKLQSKPGEPLEILEKMREAHALLKAFDIFCTSWTGWDKAIDDARRAE